MGEGNEVSSTKYKPFITFSFCKTFIYILKMATKRVVDEAPDLCKKLK